MAACIFLLTAALSLSLSLYQLKILPTDMSLLGIAFHVASHYVDAYLSAPLNVDDPRPL